MGLFLYNLSIFIMRRTFGIASFFNNKAKQFIQGRKNLFNHLKADFTNNHSPIAWFHCASLGEFEQGRPVIESFKKEFPDYKILLTFFSPSGYEIRKNYEGADFIYYLPIDTPSNAKKFITITTPSIAFFVKYEFWYHYLNVLNKKNIPAISFSAIFREDQLFFKSYSSFYRDILKKLDHIFVQNHQSIHLLKNINILSSSLTGDTRFDRVAEIVKHAGEIPEARTFKGSSLLMVIGSSWREDVEVLLPWINHNPYQHKFIIAPHEINENAINNLNKELKNSIRLSQYNSQSGNDHEVLIIDNIGMLSALYQYGDYAFIGGAFGKGLHNILEAATFGMPILFGNKNYRKFKEANDLIELGGAFPVADSHDLEEKMKRLNEPGERLKASSTTADYIKGHTGATEKIIDYSKKLLKR